MATRRERVVLDLEDHLSSGMAKAAAATALLGRSLDDLDGTAVGTEKSLSRTSREVDGLGISMRRNGPEIDRFSGRLRLALDAAAVLGPSLVPVSAVAVPAIAGLASQLGFATIGMGSLVVASQGVGDALKAVNDAALEPTAANLEKARVAMKAIGPEAQAFVARFQELRPVLGDIRDAAAAGWFPGLTESLDSFEKVAPRVASLFQSIGVAGGNLISDGAAALAGPEWSEFLSFVETNAPQALDDLGRTIGNVIKGLSELWMAFDPLNDDFSTWLLNASRSFADWSANLSKTEGFAEFVDYIRTSGPQVADALAAVGTALVEILEALAPLGGPSLKIIETFANAIAAIADSDLGTPILAGVAALSLYNRTMAVSIALQSKMALGGGPGGKGGKGGLGGTLLAATPLALGASLANQVGSEVGSSNEIFGVNVANSSPINAIKALYNRDADQFILSDTIKSLLNGGDKKSDLKPQKDAIDLRKELTKATNDAAFAESEFGDELSRMPGIARTSTESLTFMSEALSASRESAQLGAESFVNLGDSLDDSEVSLSGWLKELEGNARALAEFGRNAKAAAKKGLDDGLIASLEEAGEVGARRLEQLAGATDEEIARANRAWRRGQRAIDDYVDSVGGVPKSVATQIRLEGIQSAREALRTLRREITGSPIVQRVTVRRDGTQVRSDDVGLGLNDLLYGSPGSSADGGTVPETGLGYADRHPYLLADGEEVISNRYGQADRHRDLLKQINANRLADGGTAQHSIRIPMPATAAGADLAAAFAQQNRELRTANARLASIERTIGREHHDDRRSMKAGAGVVSRSAHRGRI